MELDDLKKSWNALDEHLKNKEFIEEKEIAQLLGRARNKMNSIDRFNRKLRFASIGILTLAVLFWICADTLTDLFYWIALSLCIPALCWDLYSAHYLSRTRIDEMPLVTVISRINRYHRWMVREWIIGILYLLAMATFFRHRQIKTCAGLDITVIHTDHYFFPGKRQYLQPHKAPLDLRQCKDEIDRRVRESAHFAGLTDQLL